MMGLQEEMHGIVQSSKLNLGTSVSPQLIISSVAVRVPYECKIMKGDSVCKVIIGEFCALSGQIICKSKTVLRSA